MVAKLIVRVQADLLPQFTNAAGATVTQVGLRLSALVSIEAGDTLPAPRDQLPDLCPWHWLSADPGTSSKWNPHDPGAWRLFRLDGGAPVEVTGLGVPPNLPPNLPAAFVAALDKTLEMIVDEGGEAAVCLPPEGQPIEQRTVFGMVESLTGLPHPVPASMRVFTVLSVDEDLAEARLVAIPRFALPKGGTFDFANPGFIATDPEGIVTADVSAIDASPWAAGLQFQLRASLDKAAMVRAPDSPRLIDLSTLSIGRNPQGTETGDEDYAAHLPARLAEALDPAARIIAAFDGIVEALRTSADAVERQVFAALHDDLAGVAKRQPSALLALLDTMTADLFQPVARASEAFPAIAVSRLGSIARERDRSRPDQRTAAASSAGQILLRMLDRDDGRATYLPGRTRHPLMSYERLGAAVGLAPEDMARDFDGTDRANEAPALDSEAGFLQFVQENWFGALAIGSSDPAVAAHELVVGTPRHLAAKALFASTLDLELKHEPVLDADLLVAPGLGFALRLPAQGDTAQLTIGTMALLFERTSDTVIAASIVDVGGPINLVVAAGNTLEFALALTTDRSVLVAGFPADPAHLEVPPPTLQAPALDLARKPFSIVLEAIAGTVADFQPLPAEPAYAAQFAASLTARSARSDLSLAFAGPYIPGILAGRQHWNIVPWPSPDEVFSKALCNGMSALVSALYTKLSNDPANPAWLTTLIGRVIEQARLDAIQLVMAAAPTSTLERITMDAPPLVVRVDQFQDFGTADAWGRVAGYGALLARTTTPPDQGGTPQEWWTLNAAELFAVPPKEPEMAVAIGIVDPVPIQVGQGGGVRQSLLSYNNRWLATGLLSDTEYDDRSGQPSTPRRPERLQAPPVSRGYLLPALSFGYSFWVLPYLIGHGGVLPLWLRQDETDPLTRRGMPGKTIADPLNDAVADARSKLYLRTRPIGSPRFVETADKPALPTVPETIPPLAAELPIRPAPITLAPGQSAMFFRDVSGQRGTLSWQTPADGELAGFRLLLGDVCEPGTTYAKKRQPIPKLQVVLWGTRGEEIAPERLWQTTLPDVVNDLRLSLLGGIGNGLTIRTERQKDTPALAEDEGWFAVTFDQAPKAEPWRDMFFEIVVPDDGAEVQFEPPVVVDVRRGAGDDLTQVDSLTTSKPQIAPEASHRSRLISLFDGIREPALDPLRLRRPGVEFGTYERWINPALIETGGGPEQHKVAVGKAINAAYRLSTREPENDDSQRDISFEDPAVTAFGIELVEIFPQQRSIGIEVTRRIVGDEVFSPDTAPRDERLATVKFDYGPAALALESSTVVKATVQKGCIYELRCYGVAATGRQDFSPFDTLARLAGPVRATLRKVSVGGTDYLLASPNVATIEMATDELPILDEQSLWHSDQALIAVDRPPANRDDSARIYLPAGLLAPPDAETHDPYRRARYAATASLYSQRWSWRGHPQAEIGERKARDGLVNSGWTSGLAETAFIGRRDEDVGDIIVRRLEKAHLYAGRGNIGEPVPAKPATAMFTKALDWRAGLNLWRFGLSVTSRYAPLFRPRQSPEERARMESGAPAWAAQAVPDRPSGRSIARPGLALVLPLTEPLMAGGATPPLLALFNERVYANFNLADGIDVAVEVARHPYTLSEQRAELERLKKNPDDNEEAIRELEQMLRDQPQKATDTLKHWQEFGPDPIRTAAAHDGSPVLLRTDGPLGYTFDAETEAGRFDHAGLLISPVAQPYRPWSMIKLRFRRLEAPEALADAKPQPLKATYICVPLAGHQFPPKAGVPVDYEGLLVEIPSLKEGDTTEFPLALGALNAIGVAPKPTVTVTVSRQNNILTIAAKTWLGDAGKTSIAIEPHESVALRLVLSGRERPEGVENWTPQGDVAIKLRIDDPRSGDDVLQRLDRDRWLAVNCVPLSATAPVAADATVAAWLRHKREAGTAEASFRPVRLSPFTPSVWCQFAESMSVLSASIGTNTKNETRLLPVTALTATAISKGTTVTGLTLAQRQTPGEPALPAILSLATGFATDVDAQLDQILLAVVTRYVTDAFARLRERPIGLIHLTDGDNRPLRSAGDGTPFVISLEADKFEAAWWGEDKGKPVLRGNGGRLRFLRMLVPRSRELGGFVDTTTRQLSALFDAKLLQQADDLNPADAAGQILGISQPIEWR